MLLARRQSSPRFANRATCQTVESEEYAAAEHKSKKAELKRLKAEACTASPLIPAAHSPYEIGPIETFSALPETTGFVSQTGAGEDPRTPPLFREAA
jgi:hypothetical protein